MCAFDEFKPGPIPSMCTFDVFLNLLLLLLFRGNLNLDWKRSTRRARFHDSRNLYQARKIVVRLDELRVIWQYCIDQ